MLTKCCGNVSQKAKPCLVLLVKMHNTSKQLHVLYGMLNCAGRAYCLLQGFKLRSHSVCLKGGFAGLEYGCAPPWLRIFRCSADFTRSASVIADKEQFPGSCKLSRRTLLIASLVSSVWQLSKPRPSSTCCGGAVGSRSGLTSMGGTLGLSNQQQSRGDSNAQLRRIAKAVVNTKRRIACGTTSQSLVELQVAQSA